MATTKSKFMKLGEWIPCHQGNKKGGGWFFGLRPSSSSSRGVSWFCPQKHVPNGLTQTALSHRVQGRFQPKLVQRVGDDEDDRYGLHPFFRLRPPSWSKVDKCVSTCHPRPSQLPRHIWPSPEGKNRWSGEVSTQNATKTCDEQQRSPLVFLLEPSFTPSQSPSGNKFLDFFCFF